MRIEEMNILDFGIYSQQYINNFSPGLNIFLGENESGKSTCLELVRSVLFGAPVGPGSTKEPKYPVSRGKEPAGSLMLRLADGRLWQRSWRPTTNEGLKILAEVRGSDLIPLDESEFTAITGEMTRELYKTVYGFSLTQLQELSSLQKESRVADVLYGAGFGLGSVSLPQVLAEIKTKQMSSLYTKASSGGKGEINALIDRLKELRAKANRQSEALPAYNRIQTELANLTESGALASKELAFLRSWAERVQELRKLKARLPELAKLAAELDAISLPRQLSSSQETFLHECRLEHIRPLANDEMRLQEELDNMGKDLATLAQGQPDASLGTIILPFEMDIIKCLQQKSQYEEGIKELQSIRVQLNELNANPSFAEAFSQAFGDNFFNLPKEEQKIKAELRLEELQEAIRGLDRLQSQWELRDRQTFQAGPRGDAASASKAPQAALPLTLLGVVASGVLAFMLYRAQGISPIWLLFALVVVLAVLGAGYVHFRRKRRHAANKEALEQQQESLLRAKQEEESELILKARPFLGTVASLLSSLDPAVLYSSAHLEKQNNLTDADIALVLDSLSWDSLRTAQSLLDSWRKIPDLIQRSLFLEQNLEATEFRCFKLLGDIFNLDGLKDITPLSFEEIKADGFLSCLNLFEHALQRAKSVKAQADRAAGQSVAIAKSLDEKRAALEEVKVKLAAIFRQAELKSLDELEKLFVAWQRKKEVQGKLEVLNKTLQNEAIVILKNMSTVQGIDFHLALPASLESILAAFLGANSPETGACSLLTCLEGVPSVELEQAFATLREKLQEKEESSKELNRQCGALQEQARALMSDSEAHDIAFEQAGLEEDLVVKSRKWAVSALALHFIQRGKSVFEAQHQTAVMTEASRFFRIITDGAYQGLDPSAEKGTFAVLTRLGETRLPEQLSRGTQEQLYLALRLAVISNRAYQAEPLPLIMDDVLVNFDPLRTKKAIKSILTLASSYQIFYFTCQPYMVEFLSEEANLASCDNKTFYINNGTIQPMG